MDETEARYWALKTELGKPDLAGLSDAAAAAKLNADTVNTTVDREVIPSYEVYEAIVPGEWANVSAANKERINQVLYMGTVNVKGANTRAVFTAAFGAGTTTRANLTALLTETTTRSRAQALPGWGMIVTDHDVNRARSLT